jgi:hypothetical protein
MPHLEPVSLRELARLSNVSARSLGRLGLPRRRRGKHYDMSMILADLVERLMLAEKLCRRWIPGELECRLADQRARRREESIAQE